MAGESLSLTELKQWYSTFNTVIKNYSGGTISELATPDGGAVIPSDINALYDKITAMKNDEFLGTQPTYYSTFTKVAQGELVERTDATPVIDTATKIAAIKCRNTTTFTNGYHSNTQKSHTTNSHGSNSHGTQGNGAKSKGTHGNQNNANGCNSVSTCSTNWCNNSLCYWGAQGNGTEYNGTNSHGAKSHTVKSHGDNTHSSKSHSTQIDILNVNTTTNKN